MLDKLEAIKERYLYLEEQLSDPNLLSDMNKYKKVGKEYKDLKDIVNVYEEYKEVLGNIDTAKDMLKDEEMKEMAKEELDELEPQRESIEDRIKVLLIPKDPEDAKDVIFEIRSGTGGDEASIFAGDLYRMYTKFFDSLKFKVETLSVTEGTAGGYSKLVLEVKGDEVFGKLKFESGVHRVQRVPKTESQGRLHTSAATVAVIPQLEEEDVDINMSDVKVDTYRASGAGGQHVNKTESAVRFTHLPTGIVAESQESRSQLKNRGIALQRLLAKIAEVQREQRESELAQQRKSLVGTGDRSGKVRTYNYPQNRVTDHRLTGDVKNFNLDKVIIGDIAPIIEALTIMENAEKMKVGDDG